MKNTYKNRRTRSKKKNNNTKKYHKKGGNEKSSSLTKSNKIDLTKYKHLETLFKKSIICGETNECLNFGINKRFDFLLFSSLKDNLQYVNEVSIINEGDNGVVYLVKFVKSVKDTYINITFNTILKKSIDKYSDNLVYEYIVGKHFINVFADYYPNLLLTYDVFHVLNNNINNENISTSLESINNESIKEMVKYSCVKPDSISILIQYFENCDTIYIFLMKNRKNKEKMKEIWSLWIPIILYQIYFLLSDMANIFTHYDLHSKNVMLYKLPEGKYIIMNYIDKNGKIITTFKTIYIPKIIDYGRCFFYGNEHFNSKKLNDEILCKVDECNKSLQRELCGNKSGYNFFEYDQELKAFPEEHYISAPLRNKSHDLRFANQFKISYNKMFNNNNTELLDLLNDIHYEEIFGTPEVLDNNTNKIKNVEDMRVDLEDRILNKDNFKNNIEIYFTENSDNYTCIGTHNIYEHYSKKMEFIPECV
jgi:hypothetical protein